MAKETGKTGKDRGPDTADHAKPWMVGAFGSGGDRIFDPNVGLCLSKSAVNDYEREATEAAEAAGYEGDKKWHPYHRVVIPTPTILYWAKAIEKTLDMGEQSKAHAHEAECYDGTDTIDPLKTQNPYHSRDEFRLDKSHSTILITVASSTGQHLNGSTVKHHNFVTIELTTPDGRRYGDIHMTFDQFAAALVSNSHTPCTWSSFWSVEPNNVELREVVKVPDSIPERMEKRLNNRLDEYRERLDALEQRIQNRIDVGKAMPKSELAELVHDIGVLRSHFDSNRDFTVDQAREEVTSIVEQAAISVALQHDLTPQQVIENAHTGTLLQDLTKRLTGKTAGTPPKLPPTTSAQA